MTLQRTARTPEDALMLSPALTATASPPTLTYSDNQGHRVWQLVAVRIRDSQGKWRRVTETEISTNPDGTLLRAHPSDPALPAVTLHVKPDSDATLLHLEAPGGTWVAIDLAASDGEHYLGLGERFDTIDQRGKAIDLYVTNGAVRDLTYKPIPFFLSNAGYGGRLLNDRRAVARFATPDDPKVVSLRTEGPTLDLKLYHARTYKDILRLYTHDVGRPAIPPAWVFGPWKSRDWTAENQQTVLEDACEGRRHRLAGTVKLIDALWEPDTHTFTFDTIKYSDPEGMIQELHALGYRLVVWVSPFMVRGLEPSEAYRNSAEKGYLIKDASGKTYVHHLGNSPTFIGSCIDFTNPEAVAWWQENIRRLVRLGVSGFKTDFGEQVPEDAHFFDGRTGREVHNIFPRLYNEATYEAMSRETEGVLLARSAWDGSQRLSAIWAGDQTSDFGPASGLQSVIIAGQTAGLSGFPYWASDIGGYFGVPTDEVFIRWTQFGAFSPIMQIHGMGKREPWNFAPETLELYRRYAQLHLDLFPYLYTYAHEAQQTGLPIMRALALEFPNDPQVWGDMAEHQYLFGEQLLVAPIYYGFNRYRHAYLPHGAWRDFWTGEPYEGGRTITVSAELDIIPVFARGGALIPLLDPSPDTLLPTNNASLRTAGDDLRLWIYPGADNSFTLYDGTRFTWHEASQTLVVINGKPSRQLAVRVAGPYRKKPSAMDEHGQEIDLKAGSLNGELDYVRLTLSPQTTTTLTWPHVQDQKGGE